MDKIAKARSEYDRWCEKALDNGIKNELLALRNDEDELIESFYGNLKFGTSGIRGILGCGTNRMNIYVVRRTTQGLCNYLKKNYENPSVVIAYDSRKNSRLFAKETAQIISANGIDAYLFSEITPVPVLSYAIGNLGTTMGVMITASHNPKIFNGYKVYSSDGYQVVGDVPDKILDEINSLDFFDDFYFSNDNIIELDDTIKEKFTDDVVSMMPLIPPKEILNNLSVVYTPLNGAGNKYVRKLFEKAGFENVHIVEEQEMPDSNFTTCPVPNPEKLAVYDRAFKLYDKVNGDIIIATDPDSDRVGAALTYDDMKINLSGNQIGILILKFLCEHREIPENSFIMKSIVTTPLVEKIAASYGIKTVNTLTGFKYIGEQIAELMNNGNQEKYFFGFEESNGFLISPFIRDKDGISTALIIAIMAAVYKQEGKTLIDKLQEIYVEYGRCIDKTKNFVFEGIKGIAVMQDIMKYFRNDVTDSLGKIKIIEKTDYLAEDTGLPKADVIKFSFDDNSVAIIRPSGTEPKIKVYMFSEKGRSEGEKEITRIMKEFQTILD